jgi:hypothetical protein
MENKSYPFANLLSWVFHPLLIPTYGIILIFSLDTYFAFSIPPLLKWATYGVVFISTCMLPSITVFGMVRSGLVKSLQMEEREERQVPYIVTAGFYTACYYLMTQLKLPSLFLLMMLGACVSVILALIINFWWKISIHTIGMGGLCGIVYSLSQNMITDMVTPFVVCVLLAGFVATARMFAGKHVPAQIYSGFILGFIAEYLLMGL